jgi:hypothetical protein
MLKSTEYKFLTLFNGQDSIDAEAIAQLTGLENVVHFDSDAQLPDWARHTEIEEFARTIQDAVAISHNFPLGTRSDCYLMQGKVERSAVTFIALRLSGTKYCNFRTTLKDLNTINQSSRELHYLRSCISELQIVTAQMQNLQLNLSLIDGLKWRGSAEFAKLNPLVHVISKKMQNEVLSRTQKIKSLLKKPWI